MKATDHWFGEFCVETNTWESDFRQQVHNFWLRPQVAKGIAQSFSSAFFGQLPEETKSVIVTYVNMFCWAFIQSYFWFRVRHSCYTSFLEKLKH
jgi:hypothetical protein